MKKLALRTLYWLAREIGNGLGHIGGAGVRLHEWGKRKMDELNAP